LILMKLIP